MHRSRYLDHAILMAGVVFMLGPVSVLVWQLVAGIEPAALWALLRDVWFGRVTDDLLPASAMMMNSFVLALGLASVKSVVAMLAAYALVLFRLPGQSVLFALILASLFFPLESRILPTFAVVNDLGLLNSYAGMILPLVASGLGVLLFGLFLRQFPQELLDAAKLDGAGPLRFFADFVVPLSLPMATALFALLFVLGWNQYVWPLMITTTSQSHDTLVRGMAFVSFESRAGLALAVMALLPPAIMVLILQRALVRGLTTGIH